LVGGCWGAQFLPFSPHLHILQRTAGPVPRNSLLELIDTKIEQSFGSKVIRCGCGSRSEGSDSGSQHRRTKRKGLEMHLATTRFKKQLEIEFLNEKAARSEFLKPKALSTFHSWKDVPCRCRCRRIYLVPQTLALREMSVVSLPDIAYLLIFPMAER
jgi:hypothetical protein